MSRVDVSEVQSGLSKFGERLNAAVDMYAQTAALNLQNYAKENRPWTDRTNRARQGLTGSSESTQDSVRIVLAHTVDYGLWLELAHEKNYAIVEPTVRLKSGEIVAGMRNLLEKVKV